MAYNKTIKRQEANTMNQVDKMIDMIASAYISVYGAAKWNSLTDQQKHDAVMIIACDALNRRGV